MDFFNKSFFQSLILAFSISIVSFIILFFTGFFEKTHINYFWIYTSLLFVLSFVINYCFLEYFLLKKIKKIYQELLPKSIKVDELVSTNMDELVENLKNYSKKNQTQIKSMKDKENFRRDFIGNLAHELKTPLFTSQSYLLTLIDGAIEDDKVNLKYLKIAEKAVERLIFIVKDLDLITKLESDNMKLEKSKFNLMSIIDNVFEMLEIQANKKNISLLIDSKIPRVNVYADQEKIHQVLTNLIENSIKYGKQDGTTEISIEDLVNDKLIIRITDNGKGIKNENFERLFERFYRVENSGNRSTGGSGLGLAIVKHIIDAHNEKIYVESDFGIGSEFSFTLEKPNK